VVVGVLVVMWPRRHATVGIGVEAGVGGRQATVDVWRGWRGGGWPRGWRQAAWWRAVGGRRAVNG
jgi:hypothetical protein